MKVKRTKSADAEIVVSVLEGDSPNFKRRGIHYETGSEVWTVTAENA